MPDEASNPGPSTWTLASLEERLQELRAAVAERARLTKRLESTRRHQAFLHARIGKLQARVDREQADVETYEEATLSALMEQWFGDLEARQDKERREWVSACLHLEQARAELASTKADCLALERRIGTHADPNEDYARFLSHKDRWLTEHGADALTRTLHVAERNAVLADALRELDEALWAGQVAKAALTGVLHALSKAQALGRLDMVGMASSFGKFSHIDDAHRHASSANRALSRFQMELADVQTRHEAQLSMEVKGLATFADFFLDDLVSDWVVQCRIDRSHSSASIARTRVNRSLRVLVERRHHVSRELKHASTAASQVPSRPHPPTSSSDGP